MRSLALASAVALGGCDPGLEINDGGTVYAGPGVDFILQIRDSCPGTDIPITCVTQMVYSLRSYGVDPPFTARNLGGPGDFVLHTDVEATGVFQADVVSEDGNVTVTADLEAHAPDSGTASVECAFSEGGVAQPYLVAIDRAIHVPELHGWRGHPLAASLPDLAGLDPFPMLPRGWYQAPDAPGPATLASTAFPEVSFDLVAYDPTSVATLDLAIPPSWNTPEDTMLVDASATVDGREICVSPGSFSITIETPDACMRDDPDPEWAATSGHFRLYARPTGTGTCDFTIALDGTSATASAQVPLPGS